MKAKDSLLLAAAVLLIGSCSFDYDEVRVAEDLSEHIPNSIVRNYVYVDVKPHSSSLRIYAGEARMYHANRRTELWNVFFQEIDPEDKVITEGEADRAVIDTRSDNVELFGAIRCASADQEAEISADYLFWNNETRLLEGKEEGEVLIEKADGTRIRGRGFSIDTAARSMEFRSPVEGTYVYTEEGDD
jgi:LPS export ABC transporter protein LptC